MKVFSFLIILIVSIILSSKNESEAFGGNNWFWDWITKKNNDRETTTAPSPVTTTTPSPVTTTTVSITEDEEMQAITNISYSINQFAFELHKAMAKKTDGSFISSPLSAAMVLMMAAYGARDENAKKVNSLLHFDTNNRMYKTGINLLIEMFNTFDPIRFKIGNKIYAGKNQDTKSDLISLVSKIFESSIENVDFGSSKDTMKKVNDWRAEIDHQRIRNVIESDEISKDTELFFINSLYFSALWKCPFDETMTAPTNFLMNNGEVIVKPVMSTLQGANSHRLPELERAANTLEFKGDINNDDLMKFTLIDDSRSVNIDDLGRDLHALHLFDFKKNSDSYMEMPKFRIESTINLEDMLNDLEIITAFEKIAKTSSISKQGSELKMNRVAQKLTFEINELGIEAAVHSEASFDNGTTTNSDPEPLEQVPIFIGNPFVFLITYNNTILFTGRFIKS
ncbi:serpin B4-like [Microplitis mediator]|uniref:serpin B4-like n=1 Tax=Microplitis mediator TaxID=375433 RepID=UPI002556C67F|nr:serpin B4-like [Microplitis mediator]